MTEHKIIFGDSRSLNQIKDKSVQLIITSPPYWQLKVMAPKIRLVSTTATKNT